MPLAMGLVGFGAALLAYVVVLLLVLASHPSTRFAYGLIGALIVSIFWCAASFYTLWATASPLVWLPVADGLHLAAWVGLVAIVLLGSGPDTSARRVAVAMLAIGTACVALVLSFAAEPTGVAGSASQIEYVSILALTLLGLLGVEQISRNVEYNLRRAVRPFAIGVGLIFVLDIFSYSQAFIASEANAFVWQLRGIGNAVAAPLLIVAIKRRDDWESNLFVSRHVVFHTATLIAAGLYLLALGLVGATLRPYQGGWPAIAELFFFVAACGLFVYALFSTTVHRRIKVFIAKHFYRNRYDYREEWLRFIGTLAGDTVERPLSERSVRALAEIIGSPSGELWVIARNGVDYEGYGGWNAAAPTAVLHSEHPLVKFMQETNWIVDTWEYENNPELYEHAFASDESISSLPSIFVPLAQAGTLVGIARLQRPSALGALGFEDHDLLKTAGQQVAVFLAQERAQLELAETRQLEAFSKLTAFLMHDLKNLISQQELVVGNARRFKHRPDFIEDTIRTIEASVERMKRVLARLQAAGELRERPVRLELRSLVDSVARACGDRQPMPEVAVPVEELWVELDREKLVSVLTHAIRNAQDATPDAGSVRVSLTTDERFVVLDVTDDGEGMDAVFVRDRLFKPFDSTKGAKGMGIGAYQIRETIRSVGGSVEVDSAIGRGTSLRMKIPLVRAAETPLGRQAARNRVAS